MIHGLRTTVYVTNDLAAAKEWYSEMLGFAPYFNEPFYAGFNVGGYELGLMPKETAPISGDAVTYWGVSDARAAFARLLELGAREHQAPTEVGEGIIVASVLDPFGNIFGVIFNPHFKAA